MKISARNTLEGRIVEIVRGATTSPVRIDIGGAVVTASITNEAVAELRLETGRQAYAVVKASDVMVGIDQEEFAPVVGRDKVSPPGDYPAGGQCPRLKPRSAP